MAASQIFHSVGRRMLNQILKGSVAAPTTYYLGLRCLDGAGGHNADAAPADVLSNSTAFAEVSTSGTGYSRIAVLQAAMTESANGADSDLTWAQQTFTFTGTVNGITHAFICTTASGDNTGVLVFSAPLAVTRNVANGDTLRVTAKFTLTQG